MTLVSQPTGRLEIGKAISDTFAIVGRNFWIWVGLAVILYGIPIIVLVLLVAVPIIGVSASPETFADLAGYSWIPIVGIALLYVAAVLLLQSALTRGTIEDLSGKRPSLGDCISTALSVFLPVLGFAVLAFLAVVLVGFVGGLVVSVLFSTASEFGALLGLVGSLLIIVPILMLVVRWIVAVPVIVQERRGVLDSMKRSAELTKGSRWALFGLLLVVGIIIVVIRAAAALIGAVSGEVAGVVVTLVVEIVLSTVLATAVAVSYVALRRAKEGTGVEELAQIFA